MAIDVACSTIFDAEYSILIDWSFANIALYRTFGLFMPGGAQNRPIFQPPGAILPFLAAQFSILNSPSIGIISCLQLQFNLDQQSLKAETFSIKEFFILVFLDTYKTFHHIVHDGRREFRRSVFNK